MAARDDAGTTTFDTRQGFAAAVRGALGMALKQRARRMVWVDSDFADWPLDDALLLQGLTDWLRLPQRRLQMLVAESEDLRRQHARFMDCYRIWSHAIEILAPAQDDAADLPCQLLVEATALMQVHDKQRWHGVLDLDRVAVHAHRLQIDAILQRSGPTSPVTTLGL